MAKIDIKKEPQTPKKGDGKVGKPDTKAGKDAKGKSDAKGKGDDKKPKLDPKFKGKGKGKVKEEPPPGPPHKFARTFQLAKHKVYPDPPPLPMPEKQRIRFAPKITHEQWLVLRASPKNYAMFEQGEIDRGSPRAINLLMKRIKILQVPKSVNPKYIAKPIDDEKISQLLMLLYTYIKPSALKYKATDRINELAEPKCYPPPECNIALKLPKPTKTQQERDDWLEINSQPKKNFAPIFEEKQPPKYFRPITPRQLELSKPKKVFSYNTPTHCDFQAKIRKARLQGSKQSFIDPYDDNDNNILPRNFICV